MPIDNDMVDKMRDYWPDLHDQDFARIRSLDEDELEEFVMQRFRVSEEEAREMIEALGEGSTSDAPSSS